MDFTPTEEQQAVADLADAILGDSLNIERHQEIEAVAGWFDRSLWAKLADSGLLGIALDNDVGGVGLDAVSLALILRAQGNHVAPLPLLPTCMAALIIDLYGSTAQRNRILPGVSDGSTVLTVAVQEYLDDRLHQPSCHFESTSDGKGFLSGRKVVVEYLDAAQAILVTASTEQGPRCIMVEVPDSGLEAAGIRSSEGTSTRRQPLWDVTFDGVVGEVVGGNVAVTSLLDHLRLGICATQLGVTEQALALTAEYTSSREQFGRPLAAFQAVGQRLADQFVNVSGIRLATMSAAWRLANGQDASEDLLVAKWWASERATDIANATQHCHGGVGVAKSYPLHRYTLWNKHLTTSLGAGTQTLRHLGNLLAAG
ncbi:MAG: acyl-CoA dehydrogenase [Acidimicrobiaceae bacterium]|nr:acyl-CoA dehydrogenase [Acidimicrobiaceae bacterium]|tara:strand:- start:541 stop:1650 length:1110 start_codon:yes stop_codon:yes gene_type:complete